MYKQKQYDSFVVEDNRQWHYTIIENNILDNTEHFKKVYDKIVYIAISRFANITTKQAYPSIKRIAKMCMCSEHSVRDSIKRLEEMKLIEVIRSKNDIGNNNPNIYHLLPIPDYLKTTSQQEVPTSQQEVPTSQQEGGVLPSRKEGTSQQVDELYKYNYKNMNNNINNNINAHKRIYNESSTYYKMAKYLLDKILEWKPNFKMPNLQLWAEDFRKIIELDKRTKEEVKDVIDFATNDDFWQVNILSASKLRKQFDTLQAQLIKKRRSNNKEKSSSHMSNTQKVEWDTDPSTYKTFAPGLLEGR